ncbi:hypothetical protein RJ639_022283 [Escallonia herrerae]|uniref:ABC transporter domain-containing protein n=1 Tax=Escallonia herrerae TaxID=1293975 RepID=A0AA88V6Z9_9ASTE|nr:hypothetical protein RJ639_022283 [Escallonia herrerae]
MSELVRMIPKALSAVIQVKVSFDRINSFLLDDELKNQEKKEKPNVAGIRWLWDPESKTPTLKDINLEVKRGQKVAICGPVGAGKSSILCSILGKITRTLGIVNVFGSIAYVSQSSWIQSGTIQDNILFGKPMETTKYEKAGKKVKLRTCMLEGKIRNCNVG